MFAHIRKALVAGFGAGATAGIGALAKVFEDGTISVEELGGVVGAVLVAAAVVGYSTFKVENKTQS